MSSQGFHKTVIPLHVELTFREPNDLVCSTLMIKTFKRERQTSAILTTGQLGSPHDFIVDIQVYKLLQMKCKTSPHTWKQDSLSDVEVLPK